MKTIHGWRHDEFVVLYGGLNQVGGGFDATAFVMPNSIWDNGTLGRKTIYVFERQGDVDTYLHELSHLTKLVPNDTNIWTDGSPFESVKSGVFYDGLASDEDDFMALKLKLLSDSLARALGFAGYHEPQFASAAQCCEFSRPFANK